MAHNGRNIPFFALINILRNIYALSYPLALLLTVVGFVWCGRLVRTSPEPGLRGLLSLRLHLDLHDLAKHNHIEHDGSLSHADALPGHEFAPSVPDEGRLLNLLDTTSVTVTGYASHANTTREKRTERGLTFFDLCCVRTRRDSELKSPLGLIHAAIARGEIALILLAFGGSVKAVPSTSPSHLSFLSSRSKEGDVKDTTNLTDFVVRRDWLKQWFGEERLPEGWVRPSVELGLLRTTFLAQHVEKEVKKISRFM